MLCGKRRTIIVEIDASDLNHPTNALDFGPAPQPPGDRGIVAMSATYLQGVFFNDPLSQYLRRRTPLAVLGKSIYLFDFDPADSVSP